MHRRTFVSGLSLIAAAASQGFVIGVGAQTPGAAAPPKPPQGKWTRLAPFPQAIGELLGVAVAGKIYASQGLMPGFKPAGLVYEYDPAGDAWTQKKPMPHPVHHAAVTASNGKMYVFGGFDLPSAGPPGWNPVADAWEYDPAADDWRKLASMPTARGAGAAAVVGGKVYVIGGAGPVAGASDATTRPRQPQRSLGTVEEYDPATNTWLTRSPMPTARSGLNTATVSGIIYTAGGEVQTGKYLAAFRAFEAYDPASDTWWQLPPMLLPRHEAIMAALGNKIHVAGGSVRSAIVPLPKGLSFDTDSHEVFEVAS